VCLEIWRKDPSPAKRASRYSRASPIAGWIKLKTPWAVSKAYFSLFLVVWTLMSSAFFYFNCFLVTAKSSLALTYWVLHPSRVSCPSLRASVASWTSPVLNSNSSLHSAVYLS
jgi:hypothetical protein